jgi:hypothetical protein
MFSTGAWPEWMTKFCDEAKFAGRERVIKTSQTIDVSGPDLLLGCSKLKSVLTEFLASEQAKELSGSKTLAQIVAWIIGLFSNGEEWDLADFDKLAAELDYEKSGKCYRISGFNIAGAGFFHAGSFVVPYHITRGAPIKFGERWLYPVQVDEDYDRTYYGRVGKVFPVAEGDVKVFGPGVTLLGKVHERKPLQAEFAGEPIEGWSGLPIVDSFGKVCGVYSTHLSTDNGHLCIQPDRDWSSALFE